METFKDIENAILRGAKERGDKIYQIGKPILNFHNTLSHELEFKINFSFNGYTVSIDVLTDAKRKVLATCGLENFNLNNVKLKCINL